MTCYPGGEFGGIDFCADACVFGDAPSAPDRVCLESGAELKSCKPSQDGPMTAAAPSSNVCGDEQLRCFRTDLTSDEGLCATFSVCESDADCAGSVRTTCAATVLQQLYPYAGASLQLSNLYCLQLGCAALNASCGKDEVCLPKVLPPSSRPFDLCVPKCTADLTCPPDFFCVRRVSGPSSPAVCLPGLLGFRCSTSNDCMVGECVETGTGFKVCSLPCEKTDDCKPFRGPRGNMACVSPTPGQAPHCMMFESFGGASCKQDSDCLAGEKCFAFSPYGTITAGDPGYCLVPCAADNTCPSRGGIPEACQKDPSLPQPVCYPGVLGITCTGTSECFPGLECLPARVPTASDVDRDEAICTLPCANDADCSEDSLFYTSPGFCKDGVCLLPQWTDIKCTSGLQCATSTCAASMRPAEAGMGVTRCTVPSVGG
jgi:hypothetical protein